MWAHFHYFPIFLTSVLIFLSIFFKSCSAGNSSGLIPLSWRNFLTPALFLLCSWVIDGSPRRAWCFILWFVTSVAKSFAFNVTVGRTSARGHDLTHNLSFIFCVVLPPNKIASHLLLILAIPSPSTPLSKASSWNSLYVVDNFFLALNLSISNNFCSIISCFLVWTAKYAWAKAISSFLGSPFWAMR